MKLLFKLYVWCIITLENRSIIKKNFFFVKSEKTTDLFNLFTATREITHFTKSRVE